MHLLNKTPKIKFFPNDLLIVQHEICNIALAKYVK